MKNIKSTALLILTAMIWGFAFVAQRVGMDHVEPFTFTGVRFFLGALSLIPVFLIFEKTEKDKTVHTQKTKTTILAGLAAGTILFTASALQQFGVVFTQSAGKSGFITSLYTVLVPVFGIALGKKTNKNTWLGALLAVGGMFLLSVADNWRIELGDLVLLIGAVFWAFHILIIDHFVERIYALRFAFVQFLFCSLLGLLCALIWEEPQLDAIGAAIVPILYGGVGSVGVAYTCQILGQRGANPTSAAIILSTECMFSAIGGVLILQEVMSMKGYIGCILIFAGVVVSQLQPKGKKYLN